MELSEFLVWLMSAVGATGAFSFIAEQFEGWHQLSPKVRYWVSVVASSLLGLGAWAVVTYVPPEVLESLRQPFLIVSSIVVTYFSGQAFHKVTKQS